MQAVREQVGERLCKQCGTSGRVVMQAVREKAGGWLCKQCGTSEGRVCKQRENKWESSYASSAGTSGRAIPPTVGHGHKDCSKKDAGTGGGAERRGFVFNI